MARRTKGAITHDSQLGRTLLALRAGPMTSGELAERFSGGSSISQLSQFGLVQRIDDRWTITEAGRAACPLRNPLAAAVSNVPKGAMASRSTIFEKSFGHAHLPNSNGELMPNLKPETAIAKVRRMLAESPQGVARKDLIQRTGLEATRIDNAIFNLIRLGEATRPGYGVIALAKDRMPLAPAMPNKAKNSVPLLDREPVRAEPLSPAPCQSTPERSVPHDSEVDTVDFSIHADGKLTITSEFDGTISLSASETVRLHNFLSRINPAVLQPQLN